MVGGSWSKKKGGEKRREIGWHLENEDVWGEICRKREEEREEKPLQESQGKKWKE